MLNIPLIPLKFVYALVTDKHGRHVARFAVINYSVEKGFCVEEGEASCNYLALEKAFLTPAEAAAPVIKGLLQELDFQRSVANAATQKIGSLVEQIGWLNDAILGLTF